VGVSGLLAALLAIVPLDVPVDPGADEARDLLREELSKQEYLAAKPTWFDLLIQSFTDWLNQLTTGTSSGGPPSFGILVVAIVVIALLVVAFLIFGLPRINRRSSVTGSLFGEDDARTSAMMRSAAELAASAGNYELAIAEMYRAIARGLAERTVLTTSPGTTALGFSSRAARAFPAQATALADAAAAFDDVRYLDRPGTEARYTQVATLERQLRAAKPALEAVQS